MEDGEELGSEEDWEEGTERKESRVKARKGLVVNISDTQYPVIRYVFRKLLNWRLISNPESPNFDLWWTDSAIEPDKLAHMQPYQKVNHFPGMYALAKKNYLARNLTKMRKAFPEQYAFYPNTWVLPAEFADLKTYSLKAPKSTYIVKPDASSQGRGIFLTRSIECLSPMEHFVVQRYLEKPFLIEDLKFDLRIYVLLAGCDPLRVFIHEEGLTRLATEEYCRPREDNLDCLCMHLTNYALNKSNPNFVFNDDSAQDDVGHKRSLASTYRLLEALGRDVEALKGEIADIVIKTLCSVQPSLSHYYRSCQPEDLSNGMCFELLGFDILLDSACKPWLLEVNHSPSFTTDTPLDEQIKRKVIYDTVRLLNCSVGSRKRYFERVKTEIQQRALHGKGPKLTKEAREAAWQAAQQKRDRWEAKHLGGFVQVYPRSDKYEAFVKTAEELWQEWTGGNINRVRREGSKEDVCLSLSVPKQSKKHAKSLPHASLSSTESRPASAAPSPISVFERLFKRAIQRKTPVSDSSLTLPSIYALDPGIRSLLALQPQRPPSAIPIQGRQCFPKQPLRKRGQRTEATPLKVRKQQIFGPFQALLLHSQLAKSRPGLLRQSSHPRRLM